MTIKEYVAYRKEEIKNLVLAMDKKPSIAIVQVNEDAGSNAYVKGKLKDAAELGINADLIKLPLDNDQGDKEAYIPLFEDYLKICKESGKRPIIEFKPKNPKAKHLKKLVKYIDEFMGLENVTFIAFYPWPLIKLRNRYHKRVHLQQLLEEGHYKTLYKWAKFFKMDIDIEDKLLTQDLVDLFHKKNLKVNVWTIDEEKNLRKLEGMGVDYITTNVFQQND